MTAFYTYIAFSQYMLIWYANLPEKPSSRDPRPGYLDLCQPGAAYCPLLHFLLHSAVRPAKVI